MDNNFNTNRSHLLKGRGMANPKSSDRDAAGSAATAETIAATAPARSVREVRRLKSEELFQQRNEVEIEHGGRIYRLRLKQLNKLILTA